MKRLAHVACAEPPVRLRRTFRHVAEPQAHFRLPRPPLLCLPLAPTLLSTRRQCVPCLQVAACLRSCRPRPSQSSRSIGSSSSASSWAPYAPLPLALSSWLVDQVRSAKFSRACSLSSADSTMLTGLRTSGRWSVQLTGFSSSVRPSFLPPFKLSADSRDLVLQTSSHAAGPSRQRRSPRLLAV